MFSQYRTSISLIAGVAVGWLANWALMNAMPVITQGAVHGNTSAPWVATFYSCAFVVSMMLPGFVAGLVSGRRGILIGAVAASILALIAMIPEALVMAKASEWSIGEVIKMLLSAFTRYPANIIASAVAGGCAELLRSNTSLERTRGR
jgi:MFS family permease